MLLQSAIVSQLRLANNSYSAGVHGEQLAAALLERAGYRVDYVRQAEHAGDLKATDPATGETWRVEVKTARRERSGRWQFLMRKADRHGVTDCANADVVLLLAVLKTGTAVPFLIPCPALAGVQKITISSHPEEYAGKWSIYRQRGPLVLGECVSC